MGSGRHFRVWRVYGIVPLIYDDAVENIVLTQEFFEIFTRNLSKFPKRRIVTARRLFYGLLTSAEP